ncbi:NERD domain-containing protein [Alkaliphilus pronyensis]|uniref:NERD domain-containing protein n=1 Tax=Alkaliphilus pronyensis TaxID=1482732 RepID=A0A6I0F149_9FIRM|nr:nuclease-related domain-containing protein [Alkaliphilus pronyensis]KAB3529196.1 NERD domain-containing protein [Alkaliphilus pronyensis]
MARIIKQNSKIKKVFYDSIKQANLRKVNYDFEKEKDNKIKGFKGELSVIVSLFLSLSKEFIVINDAVFEVTPNQFFQIDHLVIGRSKIFLVETKTWNGEFDCLQHTWMYKGLNKYTEAYKNPIQQCKFHNQVFKQWLKDNLSQEEFHIAEKHIQSLLVLNKGFIDINEMPPEIPVRIGGDAAANYIKDTPGKNLSEDLIAKIAEKIMNAELLDHYKWVHDNCDIMDVRMVYIYENEETAEQIRKSYLNKNYRVGNLNVIEGNIGYCFEITQDLEKEFSRQVKPQTSIVNTFFENINYIIRKSSFKKMIVIIVIVFILHSGITKLFNVINKALEYKYLETEKEVEAVVQIPVLEFVVGSYPSNVRGTYILVKDGDKHIIDGIFQTDTTVRFYEDKKVHLRKSDGEIIEYSLINDIIDLKVANQYTTINHNGESYIELGVFKYDFSLNDIIK